MDVGQCENGMKLSKVNRAVELYVLHGARHTNTTGTITMSKFVLLPVSKRTSDGKAPDWLQDGLH